MPFIEAIDLCVDYPVRFFKKAEGVTALRVSRVGGFISAHKDEYTVNAVEGVSFRLEENDRLALLGHNGAGKSTLLKVLSGVLAPKSGQVTIKGEVSALLSVHLGFDDHATGIDNIFIRGLFMNKSKSEVETALPWIVEFAGLGDYIQMPMKSYSWGMRTRLGFAVATAFQPEILILDEWLSAGDAGFMKKARDHLQKRIEKSAIFILAGHNLELHRKLCNKALILNKGHMVYFGDLEAAIERISASQGKQYAKG